MLGLFSFVCNLLDSAETKYEGIMKLDEDEKNQQLTKLKSSRTGRMTIQYRT